MPNLNYKPVEIDHRRKPYNVNMKISKQILDKVINEYKEGKALRTIAQKYNVSHEWVRQVVKGNLRDGVERLAY